MTELFTRTRAQNSEAKRELLETAQRVITDKCESRLYVQSIKGVFQRASTTVVGAADQIGCLARRLETGVHGPLANIKPHDREMFSDKLNKTWLSFMTDLVGMGRCEEVVEISRAAACAADQKGNHVRVASTVWADTVTSVFSKKPEIAKGMIVAAEVLSDPLDWTFKGMVKSTAKTLNLDLQELVATTPARTAYIVSKNYIKPAA